MRQPHVSRLSIYSIVPPLTDPRIVLQRADEVGIAFRMVGDAQTSTLVFTGDPGAGKSTLAAILYRGLESAAQAGQVGWRHFVWLSIGPNVTLPDVIAAVLSSVNVTDVSGVGVNWGLNADIRTGTRNGAEAGNRAGTSSTPTIRGSFADFWMLRPEEQIGLLMRVLCRPQESAFVVLDQFEELLDPADSSLGSVGRGAVPLFLDMLQSDLGASRVLLTCNRSPFSTQNEENARVRTYLVSRMSIPEGVALLQQRGVQGRPEELSLTWQRCAGHVFALVLFSTLCALSGFSLSYLLNSPDYLPIWIGEITVNLISAVYNFLNPVQRTILRSLCLFSEPMPVEGVMTAITGEEPAAVDMMIFERELNILARLALVQQFSYDDGKSSFFLHPLLRRYAMEHFLEGSDRHPSGDLMSELGVTNEPNPIVGNPETREIALAAGHMRVAAYYARLAQQYCPPSQKRDGPQDVEPLLVMALHLCLGWHWQQAYDLLSYEGLHQSMMQWGAWNTLIRLYTAMVPPLGVVSRRDEGQIFSQLGLLYGRLGDYQQSRFYFERALATQREIGDRQGEAVTLANQGELLRSIGETQQARVNFEQALMLNGQGHNAHLESVVLHNLGLLCQGERKYQEALGYYQQSLRLAQNLQEWANMGMILTNIGMLFYEQGRLQEALTLLFSALGVREAAEDRTVGSLELFLEMLEKKIGPEEFARMRRETQRTQEQVVARLGVGLFLPEEKFL